MPDKMPSLGGMQRTLWIASLMAYFANYYYLALSFAAALLGVIKKAGYPGMNMAAIQTFFETAIRVEDFHVMTYIMSVLMAPGGMFVHGPILITAALGVVYEFNQMLIKNPDTPFISISQVQNLIKQVS